MFNVFIYVQEIFPIILSHDNKRIYKRIYIKYT